MLRHPCITSNAFVHSFLSSLAFARLSAATPVKRTPSCSLKHPRLRVQADVRSSLMPGVIWPLMGFSRFSGSLAEVI